MKEKKVEELKVDEGLECNDEQLDAIAGGALRATADYEDEEEVVTKKPIPKHRAVN